MSSSESRSIYRERVGLALDFIDREIAHEMRLEDVAKAACFSPYHFHRIFTAMVGETPDDYIRRIRLEKAARMLWSRNSLSVTDIALLCGFSSPSVFSRNFRNRFNMSPQTYRKHRQGAQDRPATILPGGPSRTSDKMPPGLQSIKAVTEPERYAAYVRHKGYGLDISKAYIRLSNWLQYKGLFKDDGLFLGVYLDNPYITSPNQCRYYACYTVSPEIKGSSGVGTVIIAGGLYVRLDFDGPYCDFDGLYHYFYRNWLPDSGLEPDVRPDFLIFPDPPDWRNEYIHVRVCIAAKTLS
jgi:AraC family transcriptional regulator